MGKRVKIILNPYSNRGRAGKNLDALRAALATADLDAEISLTSRPGGGIELARQAKLDGVDVIAAAGGDGTMNEVVNGIAQVTPEGENVGPVAVIPMGSGNDFADMVGVPRDLAASVATLQAGRTKQIDLCLATVHEEGRDISRYFDNNMGAGFEAQVTVESRKITRLRGFAIYLWAVIRALRQYDQPQFEVAWTDETGAVHQVDQRSLLVTLGNSRRTGGGFYMTPDALMDDGLLDMGIARSLTTLGILALLPKVMAGSHRNHPAMRFVRCSSVCVATKVPVPVHTDGEIVSVAAHALSATVQPGRLTVLV
ncbi:MAG: diacylglycerol kinase family lipid kinase [Caldilineaceae bacterium]|nr:diacylglycerol kinase family lipid kinase [Caldilineaceae bacterium]HRJ43439.1 diacylglycerol kinase family lipid kinase [Caldilineaceae bacterium]